MCCRRWLTAGLRCAAVPDMRLLTTQTRNNRQFSGSRFPSGVHLVQVSRLVRAAVSCGWFRCMPPYERSCLCLSAGKSSYIHSEELSPPQHGRPDYHGRCAASSATADAVFISWLRAQGRVATQYRVLVRVLPLSKAGRVWTSAHAAALSMICATATGSTGHAPVPRKTEKLPRKRAHDIYLQMVCPLNSANTCNAKGAPVLFGCRHA